MSVISYRNCNELKQDNTYASRSQHTSMTFSAVHTVGSNSITARSARRATLTDWMPGWSRNIDSMDCHLAQLETLTLIYQTTHLHTGSTRHTFNPELASHRLCASKRLPLASERDWSFGRPYWIIRKEGREGSSELSGHSLSRRRIKVSSWAFEKRLNWNTLGAE